MRIRPIKITGVVNTTDTLRALVAKPVDHKVVVKRSLKFLMGAMGLSEIAAKKLLRGKT